MVFLVYSQLKQYISETSMGTNERHNSEILNFLKEFFRDTINSVRKFEQINSIGQLLKVLEVRDLLSEANVDCLKNIALKLPNSKDVLQKITDYENHHMPREYGNYYIVSHQSIKKKPDDSLTTSNHLKSKKQRIIKTIIRVIGRFWRQLAINLKIRECDIEVIDIKNETFALKAAKLMEKYDEIADPQRWIFELCDALERTRRKDLVRSIQRILCE